MIAPPRPIPRRAPAPSTSIARALLFLAFLSAGALRASGEDGPATDDAATGVGVSCSLCVDGTDVPDPDLMLPEEDATCGLYQEFVSEADGTLCALYQAFIGVYCGCSGNAGVKIPQSYCSLCKDRSAVPDPALIPYEEGGDSCFALQMAAFMEEGDDPLCERLQATDGVYCGCKGNAELIPASDSACSLCSGQRIVPKENLRSEIGTETCGTIQSDIVHECSAYGLGLSSEREEKEDLCCADAFQVLEKQAMAELRSAISGSDWGNNTDYCNWGDSDMVKCDEEGWVVSLMLGAQYNSGFKGSLPTHLGNLQNLRYLDFSHVALQGGIPTEIGSMVNLQRIELFMCGLTGTIPSEVGKLVSLDYLELARNRLTGTVPSQISALKTISSLDLGYNSIIGPLPSHFGQMLSLGRLDLEGNKINGTIPSEIGQMHGLVTLDISFNELTGTLPSQFGNLHSLKSLYLNGNPLTGTLPPELGNLVLMRDARMAETWLTGPAPRLWCDGDDVVNYWGSSAMCPDENEILFKIYDGTGGDFWSKSNHWKTNISHCQWHGITCDENKYVSELDLSNNKLEGTIPHDIGYLTHLKQLVLADNRLASTLPGHIGNLASLRGLDLSNNGLTGTIISGVFRNLVELEDLSLEANDLNGTLELTKMENMASLKKLHLSYNNFTGEFPSGIENLVQLRVIDVSGNSLSGRHTIFSLTQLSELRKIVLSKNHLKGAIPNTIKDLIFLEFLDLSQNEIEGTIPPRIGMLRSLRTLDISHNVLTGSIPEEMGDLEYLDVLSLSENRLTGPLPQKLGNLQQMTLFDLSSNYLQGTIPSQLGEMPLLKSAELAGRNNSFNSPAPVKLCRHGNVDISRDESLCPRERDVLMDLYDATGGPDWKDNTNWAEAYTDYCEWQGVRCISDTTSSAKIIDLTLKNNALFGTIPPSFSNLTLLQHLDLGGNSLARTIPTYLGNLSKLKNLILSYNLLTGTIPEQLEKLSLSLIHLHGNRFEGTAPRVVLAEPESKFWYITDCGSPAFDDNAPVLCEDCSLCCNVLEECHPTKTETSFVVAILVFTAAMIFVLQVFSEFAKRWKEHFPSYKERHNPMIAAGQMSVYSFLLSDSPVGLIIAIVTAASQVLVFSLFLKSSRLDFRDEKSEFQYAWTCPRHSSDCDMEKVVSPFGWVIFGGILFFYLAPEVLNGFKLVCMSGWHRSRLRCFAIGALLIWMAHLTILTSVLYNRATAGTESEVMVNAAVLLFVNYIDEQVFSILQIVSPKLVGKLVKEAQDNFCDRDVSDEFELSMDETRKIEDQVERQKGEIELLQNTAGAQEDHIAMLRNENQTHKDQLEMLKNQSQKQKHQMEMLKDETGMRKDQIEALKKETVLQNGQIESMKKETGMIFEMQRTQIESLKNETATSKEEITALKNQIGMLKDQLGLLKNES